MAVILIVEDETLLLVLAESVLQLFENKNFRVTPARQYVGGDVVTVTV